MTYPEEISETADVTTACSKRTVIKAYPEIMQISSFPPKTAVIQSHLLENFIQVRTYKTLLKMLLFTGYFDDYYRLLAAVRRAFGLLYSTPNVRLNCHSFSLPVGNRAV